MSTNAQHLPESVDWNLDEHNLYKIEIEKTLAPEIPSPTLLIRLALSASLPAMIARQVAEADLGAHACMKSMSGK